MKRSWPVPDGAPVQLTAQEKVLADGLRQHLDKILAQLRDGDLANGPAELDALAAPAHELHMSLKAHGHEPQHHKYMLANRGCKPTDLEFYRHVHPVEDLLRFIENEHANDDPKDVTLGVECEFKVYSRRWGHEDTFRVTRTASGWTFEHIYRVHTGRDARQGGKADTGLFRMFNQDSINYPEDLPGYFEWLWDQAAERGLSEQDLKSALAELAAWVSTCEKSSPGGVFGAFK